jgi:hypothetical protein
MTLRTVAGMLFVAALTASCGAYQAGGEFDGDGWVAGRIVTHLPCPRHGQPRCARFSRSLIVDGHGPGGWGGFSLDRKGGWNYAPVPEGRWVFRVRRLERPGCRPRGALDVHPQRYYRFVFVIPRHGGRCRVIVSGG